MNPMMNSCRINNLIFAPILFGLLILSGGCTFVISTVLGIRNPEVKTLQQIQKYGLRHDLGINSIYLMPATVIDSLRETPYKQGWEKGFRPIQFKMFAANGELVSHYASCEGPRKKLGVLDVFPPKNMWPIDTNLTLLVDLKMYLNEDGSAVELEDVGDFDYLFLVYWATYTGIPGRKLVSDIDGYVSRFPGMKIKVLKINTDLTEKSTRLAP